MDPVLQRLEKLAILPALILDTPHHAIPLGQALIAGGLPCVEVTLRTSNALEILTRMASIPDLLVGAGTVTTPQQADEAIKAGARYIVSPGMDERLIRHCQDKGTLIIPGAVTATEVMLAQNLGLHCVKFFPATAIGGLAVLKGLNGPFPQMRYLPTGGITLETMSEFLSFRPVLAVGGTWMLRKEWIEGERYEIISDACATTRQRAALARRSHS